jgi:hypothetical protein
MAFAFDTLGCAKHLREAGIEPKYAEAHAEAAGKFIMSELATKHDIAAVRGDIDNMVERLTLRMTVVCGAMIFAVAGLAVAALRFMR